MASGSLTMSEIVFVFKRRDKITYTYSKLARGFPKGNAEGAFFGTCRGKMLVGHGKNIFEYLPQQGKWNRIRHEQSSRYNRFDAQGCEVNGMYLLFILPNK